MRLQTILAAALVCSGSAFGRHCAAEDDSTVQIPQAAHGFLSIRAEIPSVKVFLDSIFAGIAPLDTVPVAPGSHLVSYVHPQEGIWGYSSLNETVFVHPMERIELRVEFPCLYRVTSEPYGATVRRGDSTVGQTPLFYPMRSPGGQIVVSKDGYEEERIILTEEGRNIHVVLRPLGGPSASASSLYLTDEHAKNNLPVYLTTGATVLTGIAAAYLKVKADGYYGDYTQTGDPGTLERVRALDTASGVSLAASEISLLMLCFLLLSQ